MPSTATWPISPFTKGWRVAVTIPLVDADRTTIDWMLRQFPGGPPRVADFPQLINPWLEASERNDALFHRSGWWFFLSILGHNQLWKLFWRAQMQQVQLDEVSCDIIVPRLSWDDLWLTHPLTISQWLTQVGTVTWPTDPTWSDSAMFLTVWIGWRIGFWQQWRTHPELWTNRVRVVHGWRMPNLVHRVQPSRADQWVHTEVIQPLLAMDSSGQL